VRLKQMFLSCLCSVIGSHKLACI